MAHGVCVCGMREEGEGGQPKIRETHHLGKEDLKMSGGRNLSECVGGGVLRGGGLG